jgi:1-deoxy-D-xylulose-5-phosphate synthase
MDAELKSLPVGKGEVMREGGDATIFAIGNEVWPSVQAAEILAKEDINITVINARFVKPLDDELILKYCRQNSHVFTVEEGSLAGGFGSAVMERCVQLGIQNVQFHCIGIPDEYVHHGGQDVLRAQYDLHPEGIAKRVRERLKVRTPADTAAFLKELAEIADGFPEEVSLALRAKGKDSDHIDEFITGKGRRTATK